MRDNETLKSINGYFKFSKKTTVFIATLTLTQRDRFDDQTNYLQTFKFSKPEAVDSCSPDGFFSI